MAAKWEVQSSTLVTISWNNPNSLSYKLNYQSPTICGFNMQWHTHVHHYMGSYYLHTLWHYIKNTHRVSHFTIHCTHSGRQLSIIRQGGRQRKRARQGVRQTNRNTDRWRERGVMCERKDSRGIAKWEGDKKKKNDSRQSPSVSAEKDWNSDQIHKHTPE